MSQYESDFRTAFDSASGSLKVVGYAGATGTATYPNGATPTTAASGNVAATATTATLAAVAAKTTYITGFSVTGAGATGASVISVTVTGLIGGTATYIMTIPAGVTTAVTALNVQFNTPVPASTTNTAIVVNVPSFGSGNTNAAVVATGFQL